MTNAHEFCWIGGDDGPVLCKGCAQEAEVPTVPEPTEAVIARWGATHCDNCGVSFETGKGGS